MMSNSSSHHSGGSEHLLDLLQAHGQKFLSSFDTSVSNPRKRGAKPQDASRKRKALRAAVSSDADIEDEWSGIAASDINTSDESIAEGAESGEEDCDGDFEHEDDDFTADASTPRSAPDVVVFSDAKTESSTALPTKAQRKAFMSSRISQLVNKETQSMLPLKQGNDEVEDERTNSQNDAILYKLVHTKLLSGSASTELDLTPAQRKKALVGRVMELAGDSSLGKGEKAVREAERNKAAKNVREGMLMKQKEREKRHLDEAKDLGNYHPTLKKLYESTSSSQPAPRQREKGLKMGVGNFRGGVLKLSRDDLDTAMGGFRSGASRGRGGGKRGRGRGRGRR